MCGFPVLFILILHTWLLESTESNKVSWNAQYDMHNATFPSLHLRYNSFCNPSVALPTWQLILQPFRCFSYVTSSSLNSPGEPPMGWKNVLTLFVMGANCRNVATLISYYASLTIKGGKFTTIVLKLSFYVVKRAFKGTLKWNFDIFHKKINFLYS